MDDADRAEKAAQWMHEEDLFTVADRKVRARRWRRCVSGARR